MGIFAKLFQKIKGSTSPAPTAAPNAGPSFRAASVPTCPAGRVSIQPVIVAPDNIDDIATRFIAFDVETTGLDPCYDRIIELGAVRFDNGQQGAVYSSLVNAGVPVSPAASRVNHITDSMLFGAPREQDAYKSFTEFIADALNGDVVLCAHNARFDMGFLEQTLQRLGYNGTIKYVDTLKLSRGLLPELENHKQNTVSGFLKITNEAEHRAAADAEVCGKILLELIARKRTALVAERERYEQSKPTGEELDVCAVIQNIVRENSGDAEGLRFYKNSSGYIDVEYRLYQMFKFKIAKKGRYVVVQNKYIPAGETRTEPCTASENGAENTRLFFDSPFEMNGLVPFIMASYTRSKKNYEDYMEYSQQQDDHVRDVLGIKNEDLPALLAGAQERYEQRKAREQEETRQKEEADREKREKAEARAQKKAAAAAAKEQKEREAEEIAARRAAGEYIPFRQGEKRPILQMDDDGNVIHEYASISEAVASSGINSKSIRDAANGVQKHAGGFVWRFKDMPPV